MEYTVSIFIFTFPKLICTLSPPKKKSSGNRNDILKKNRRVEKQGAVGSYISLRVV